MASGAASTSGASQPATSASPIGGTSQAPSDAPLVEDAQERRRALDGKLYTMEEFREYYQTPYRTKRLGNWWRFWDQAVREAAAHVTSRAEPAAASATSTAEPAAADESGRGSRLVEAGNERGAFQLAEAILMPKAKAAPTPGQFAEWRDNPSEEKQRLMNEAKLILSTNVEDKKRIDAFLRELREGAREAVPPGAASARGASQPATDASPTGGTSLAPSGAPLVEHAQERRQADDGRWYTKEEFMEYYLDPYGSFSAWRRCWDRAVREAVAPGASQPGSSERVGRSALGTAALAAEPAAAPAALGASQPESVPPGGSTKHTASPTRDLARITETTYSSTQVHNGKGKCKGNTICQPNCMRCDKWGAGVKLVSGERVERRELVCRACGAIAPSSQTYVYGLLSQPVQREAQQPAACKEEGEEG